MRKQLQTYFFCMTGAKCASIAIFFPIKKKNDPGLGIRFLILCLQDCGTNVAIFTLLLYIGCGLFLWTPLVSHNCRKIVLLYALFFFADLSAVRRLMSNESTPLLSRNSRTASTTSSVKNYTDFSSFTCPSCRMPFDKAKKRRLVDTCGHERCYACMFRNETCPICNASGK